MMEANLQVEERQPEPLIGVVVSEKDYEIGEVVEEDGKPPTSKAGSQDNSQSAFVLRKYVFEINYMARLGSHRLWRCLIQ
jgi:hypothetical protein